MCTAIHLIEDGFFGRTLDFEMSFGERLVAMPREYMTMGEAKNRYSMIGVGVMREKSVLYFDGMNEWGLSGAALNFPGYAVYDKNEGVKASISSSVFLSFVLGFCKSICEVKDILKNVSISGESFAPDLPVSPLHWMFADATGSVVVESVREGLRIYDNPFGVLTNAPDFNYHTTRLADFVGLRADNPEKCLTDTHISLYSRGLGALGLPGDYSSCSRFIRALFVKENTRKSKNKKADIVRMRHILSSVSIPLGCVITKEGKPVSTIYTSMCHGERLTYYFYSYGCSNLRGIKLNPEAKELMTLDIYEEDIVQVK